MSAAVASWRLGELAERFSLELRGDPQAAVYEYAQAIEAAQAAGRRHVTADQEALAHRRMAAALDRLGRFAQAESHYKTALELRPDDPKIWNDAGYSAYLRRDWAEAERRLEKAASLDPQDARARNGDRQDGAGAEPRVSASGASPCADASSRPA